MDPEDREADELDDVEPDEREELDDAEEEGGGVDLVLLELDEDVERGGR